MHMNKLNRTFSSCSQELSAGRKACDSLIVKMYLVASCEDYLTAFLWNNRWKCRIGIIEKKAREEEEEADIRGDVNEGKTEKEAEELYTGGGVKIGGRSEDGISRTERQR
jgi:hypothetical protein